MSTMRRYEGESCKAFLERLSQENRDFYESDRGKGALKDLQQKFPHAWLYVAELIQNAVDENATIIRIQTVDEKTLVLEHNGEEFDFDKDVIGLCTKGVSSKGAGTVGFMGVGFKAVFRSYETVRISSGEWKFTLNVGTSIGKEYGNQSRNWLGAVLPFWDSTIAAPSEGMTCRFELTGRVVINHTIESDLEAVFKEDKALLPLLARQNIQELDWDGVKWVLSVDKSIPFDDNSGNRLHVNAVSDADDETFSWIIFSQEYTPSRDAIRKFLEHRQLTASTPDEEKKIYLDASRVRKVEAFFPVDADLFPILPDNGEAYALLPTSVKLPIGINIQADWLLTQSRQEFMDSDLKDNSWHREIIENIPRLTKHYFEWVISDEGPAGPGDHGWAEIYNILPGIDKSSIEAYGWFLDNGDNLHTPQNLEYCRLLFDELKSFGFIAQHVPDAIEFIPPITARVLPEKLSTQCGEKLELLPWVLFGEYLASRKLLGQKTVNTLITIGLLKEMKPQELADYWDKGIVKSWYDSFDAEVKDQRLELLLQGLFEMDEREDWHNSHLKCLPSETDEFISRPAAVRYPSDWNIIVNNKDFVAALKPFIEAQGSIVLWNFDRTVTTRQQHLKTKAKDYIETINQADLPEIVADWWDSFDEDNALDAGLISEFTTYICEKFPQRKDLITKVLSINDDQEEVLHDLDDALLAEPYARDYRRLYFPTYPVVSPCYYKTNESLNWRAFFESCTPPTTGKFVPLVFHKKLSAPLYLQLFNTSPPTLRASYIEDLPWAKSPNVKVDNDYYHYIDFIFPKTINDKLESGAIDRSFGEWLNEDSGHLRGYLYKYLLYIPSYWGTIKEEKQADTAKWVKKLDSHPWIYSKLSNDGPYKPEDILKNHDPVRPNAPVADLSHDLILLLESAGIKFGTRIPKAGPMQKLQIQGAFLQTSELAEVIEEILNEDDPDDIEPLKRILESKALIPVPLGTNLLDGSKRVPFSRIVKKVGAGFRSNLGWVISVSDLKSDVNVLKIFELLEDVYEFPQRTTANQAIDFLEWVWMQKPDAESVRRFLPFAYAYINEEISHNTAVETRWGIALSSAVVYTLGRQWVSVSGDETIFFDDLQISDYKIIPKQQLVTPSHLASTDRSDQQIAAVELLGISLLSDHYQINAEQGSTLPVSDTWAQNFTDIQKAVIEFLKINEDFDENDEGTEIEEDSAKKQNLTLKYLESLSQEIVRLSDYEVIDTKPVYAIQSGNFALICGEPADFSSELCNLLIAYYNASRKKNISLLASEITRLIFCIDRQNFAAHLEKFKSKFGIDSSSEQKPKAGDESSTNDSEATEDVNGTHSEADVSGQTEGEMKPSGSETSSGDQQTDSDEAKEEPSPPNEPTQNEEPEPGTGGSDDQPSDPDNKASQDNAGDQSTGSGEQSPGAKATGTGQNDQKQTKQGGSASGGQSHTKQGEGASGGQSKSKEDEGSSGGQSAKGGSEGKPPTKPGSGKSTQSTGSEKTSKRTSRLFSYVTGEKTASDDDYEIADDESPETIAIGMAAEAIVMNFEKQRGWSPKNMNDLSTNHHGYDIESTGPDERLIYIEVKGINGPWSNVGVGLSATQFKYAMKYQEDYFLYVVENALSADEANVYCIENPAMQVTKFQFDHGWKNVAVSETVPDEDPAAGTHPWLGQRVKIVSLGDAEGTIIDVSEIGKFQSLTIALDDGEEIQKFHNPYEIKFI